MKNILLLAANTGRGYISPMNAIYKNLCEKGYAVKVFPRFYEELIPSNQQMSDFYNLLQRTSFELCKQYAQMSLLESSISVSSSYLKYWEKPLTDFFRRNICDIVISFTPIINKYIIKYLKENKNFKFYIVVVNIFDPIYPGYDSTGADGYFVANEIVKNVLKSKGIPDSDIILTGFPLESSTRRIGKSNMLNINGIEIKLPPKIVLVIVCGAQGSIHFIKIIKEIYLKFQNYFNIIVICGSNQMLYNNINNNYKNIYCFEYIDNFNDIISSADICMTKAAANTIYQCLYSQTALLVDATKGFLYQEEGIVEFIKNNNVGEIFYTLEDLDAKINKLISNDFELYYEWKNTLSGIHVINGTENIPNYFCGP